MTQNNGSRYAPGYDLFKLIVAIILTIILILLLLQESRLRYAGLNLTVTASVPTERAVLATTTSQPLQDSTSTPVPPPTSTEPIPTQTILRESTPTATNPTESTPVAPTPTELTPTETATAEPAPTQFVAASDPNECPSNPTQIQVSNEVHVNDWLNFRTGPGLQYEIQHTNRPGTEMEVIGGPVCTIRGNDPPSAYLWWNVRMEDGREGWSAEAPLNYPNYFLEPKL